MWLSSLKDMLFPRRIPHRLMIAFEFEGHFNIRPEEGKECIGVMHDHVDAGDMHSLCNRPERTIDGFSTDDETLIIRMLIPADNRVNGGYDAARGSRKGRLCRQHDILPLWQWFPWKGIIGLASHDNRMSGGCFLEPADFLLDIPRNCAIASNCKASVPIRSARHNQCNHERTPSTTRSCQTTCLLREERPVC